jgi:hypothetical protein
MNPLYNALPATARKYLYAVLFVAALVFSLYQASQGDWLLFVGSLLTALTGLLASSNTDVKG